MLVERSSLLLDEYPLQVLPSLAAAIGLNESIFLQQLHYWLQQKPHIREGRPWVYNTVEGWLAQFPFWSKRTLERVLQKLRKDYLIFVTSEHNQRKSDRKMWYSIDYDRVFMTTPVERKKETFTGVEPSDYVYRNEPQKAYRQYGGLHTVNVADAYRQSDGMDHANMADSYRQCDGIHTANVAESLYRTETTTETTTETNTETTTNAPEGSGADADVVVVLFSLGISLAIARRLAEKYPEAYLQEKIEFLEFEKIRVPDLANPAGWLRRAVEEDFAKPSGFQSASEIEAQQVADAQFEAALLLAQREQETRIASRKAAQEMQLAEKTARLLAQIQPRYGTTEQLLSAWDEGIAYVAQLPMGSHSMLMDGLRETVLLTFEEGHAQVGILSESAHFAIRRGGKQFIRECLAYAMRDTLGGKSGTYELVQLTVGNDPPLSAF